MIDNLKEKWKNYLSMILLTVIVLTAIIGFMDTSKQKTELDGAVVTTKDGKSFILQSSLYGYKAYEFNVEKLKMVR